jgi:N-acetylglucosamine kinase
VVSEWLDPPLSRDQIVRVDEVSMGFAMALTTHGVLVLSGTGSFVHARTADGRAVHEGGQGPIIADEGSAYHIGTLGIRAAFRSHWTEARRTSLAEAVPRALGVDSLREVFRLLYIERIGRSSIASVARVVNEEAEAGDRVAQAILVQAAQELGVLLVEVIKSIGFEDSDELMVATGSVAQGSRLFWETLCDIAHEVAPRLRPVQPAIKPVMGACLLALRDMGVEWNQDLVARIEQTQREVVPRTPPLNGNGVRLRE